MKRKTAQSLNVADAVPNALPLIAGIYVGWILYGFENVCKVCCRVYILTKKLGKSENKALATHM